MSIDDQTAFVVLQEGSSGEIIAHVFESYGEAHEHRNETAEFRSSDPVEVPASIANHPEFPEVAVALIDASQAMDYPDEDADDEEDDMDE